MLRASESVESIEWLSWRRKRWCILEALFKDVKNLEDDIPSTIRNEHLLNKLYSLALPLSRNLDRSKSALLLTL
jgi:flagellar biosynthesis regulator FlaF